MKYNVSRMLAVPAAIMAFGISTAASAQTATPSASDAFQGFDPSVKLGLVVGGVLVLLGLIATASITIELFWKGHQKAKQTVKKL